MASVYRPYALAEWLLALARGFMGLATCGRPWPAVAGFCWLRLAAACHGWPASRHGYPWPVSVSPAQSGPSVAVLASRPTVPSAEGCFGWLNRCGYVADELFSTCDCLEAPRRCAADSRRQCHFILAGIVLPAALTSACVLLPVPREVAFVTCCLRRAHPSGVARRLKSACGVAS